MMFRTKRKIDIPDRPTPPTWEQMEEDLKHSTKNDIVFTMLSTNQNYEQDDSKEIEMLLSSCKGDGGEKKELFQCAVKCVELNQDLQDNVQEIIETADNLQEICKSLEENVEKVKKQALGAMKKT